MSAHILGFSSAIDILLTVHASTHITMPSVSWRPDEDPAIIYAEHTWLIGIFIMCLACGIISTLSMQSFTMLTGNWTRSQLRSNGLLAVFVALTFLVNISAMSMSIQYTLDAFINDRGFPGGPAAYEASVFSPVNTAANAFNILSTFLADALLVSYC